MGASARSGETFSLWMWRTSCETFPLHVYGATVQAAVARLRTLVRDVSVQERLPSRPAARTGRLGCHVPETAPGSASQGGEAAPGWVAPFLSGDGSRAEVETACLV